MTLRIKDWEQTFHLAEANRWHEVYWTKFPVSRNSIAYRRLMATPEGRTAFCAFIGLIRLCARGKTMGELQIKGRAIDAADIAAETGIPLKDCRRAWDLLTSQEIGWIEVSTGRPPGDDGAATVSQPGNNRAQRGPKPRSNPNREEKRREEPTAAAKEAAQTGVQDAPADADELRIWAQEQAKRPEWLPADKPWIEAHVWERLGREHPTFASTAFNAIIKEARASRKTLDNPAGFIIRKIMTATGANQ